ncbi:hypothetical protein MUP77_25670 [Candidatus Bathyarchaeota archaeon]|nr:hypothetical protein [Candidatus Bathyarchaeota archaeon]
MTQDSEPARRNLEKIDLRREKVAKLLVQGLSGPAISEKLGIPYKTVRDDVHAIRSEWDEFTHRQRIRPFQMAYIQLEQLRRELWKKFESLGNTKADNVLRSTYARHLLKVMHEMNTLVGLHDPSAFEAKHEKKDSLPDSIPKKRFKEWLKKFDPEDRAAISSKLGDLLGEDKGEDGSDEAQRPDRLPERTVQGKDVQSSTQRSDKQTDDDSSSERRKDHTSDN